MRVFIGPNEIAGIGRGLLRGFEELGIDVKLILAYKHPFRYGQNKGSFFINFWQILGGMRAKCNNFLLLKVAVVLLHRMLGFCFLAWALFRFDVFIFLYGCTFTDTEIELKLLRAFKKKIIFINCGADIRPPYMDGVHFSHGDINEFAQVIRKLTKRSKCRAMRNQKYSDYIVAQPSNAHFYEDKIINYFSIGVPMPTVKSGCVENKSTKIRIVHSPSNPMVKGSEIIEGVLQEFIDKGVSIEYIRLQGVRNEEVLKVLENCDFIVDQLYSDIPLAIFGAEAACFGKPCIISGYLAGEVNNYISQNDLPPSLYVRPEQLRESIEKLVEDKAHRNDLGLRAQEFVSQRWTSKAVAERYLKLLNGQAQSDWWFDPANITYVGGCGLPMTSISNLLALIIETYGVKALQVSDKPKLEQALVELAQQAERVCSDA